MIDRVYLIGFGFVLLDTLTNWIKEPPEKDRLTWVSRYYYNRSPVVRGSIKGVIMAIAAICTEMWLQAHVEPALASGRIIDIVAFVILGVISVGIGWSMGGAILFNDKEVVGND